MKKKEPRMVRANVTQRHGKKKKRYGFEGSRLSRENGKISHSPEGQHPLQQSVRTKGVMPVSIFSVFPGGVFWVGETSDANPDL